jgi:hypothetical protein
VENDLQQQVAELLAQISEVSTRNGVCDLVGLFDGVWGRSQGQPEPGVRNAAMIASSRSMSGIQSKSKR